jgi:hypothetical protein
MCLTENLTLECPASTVHVPDGINGAVRLPVLEAMVYLSS